jgi:hypothetical protein
MKRKLKKPFKLKGEMYIDTLIGMVITCLIIALGMSILPIMIGQYMLSVQVNNIARDIAINGYYEENISLVANGKEANITVTPNTSEFYATNNGKVYLQLGTQFTVEASTPMNLSLGGFGSSSVTLHCRSTERSEKYWEDLDTNSSSTTS